MHFIRNGSLSAGKAPGAPHLARRGAMINMARARLGKGRVLIADDSAADCKYLMTTIRIIVGSENDLVTAPSLRKAIEALEANPVDVIFIDDRISGIEKFETSMPQLRKAGFAGPVIVVSGFLSPERRRMLFELGAVDAIHKDDIEALRVSEAIVRALAPDKPAPA